MTSIAPSGEASGSAYRYSNALRPLGMRAAVLEIGSPTTSTSFRNDIPSRIGPARSPGMTNLSRIGTSAAVGGAAFGASGSDFFGVAQAANASNNATARAWDKAFMMSAA